MRARYAAVIYLKSLFEDGYSGPGTKLATHFGKMELRALMDYIYGGPPLSPLKRFGQRSQMSQISN